MKNQNEITVKKWNEHKKPKTGKYCLTLVVDGLISNTRLNKTQLIQLSNDIDNLIDKIQF